MLKVINADEGVGRVVEKKIVIPINGVKDDFRKHFDFVNHAYLFKSFENLKILIPLTGRLHYGAPSAGKKCINVFSVEVGVQWFLTRISVRP